MQNFAHSPRATTPYPGVAEPNRDCIVSRNGRQVVDQTAQRPEHGGSFLLWRDHHSGHGIGPVLRQRMTDYFHKNQLRIFVYPK